MGVWSRPLQGEETKEVTRAGCHTELYITFPLYRMCPLVSRERWPRPAGSLFLPPLTLCVLKKERRIRNLLMVEVLKGGGMGRVEDDS